MHRRAFLQNLCAGGTLAVGLSVTGCIGLRASDAERVNENGTFIEMIDDNRFEPETITIPVGETVVWRNTGYVPHTMTAYEDEIPTDATYFASGGFTSESAARSGASEGDGVLNRDEEYEHTFDVPGTYAYFCIPHEQTGMTDMITVEETAESNQDGA